MDRPTPDLPLSLAKRAAARYSEWPHVEAVALAGSHTIQVSEQGSDIDLYVYWHAEIPLEARRAIAEVSGTRVEVNNQFWEPGDEWIDEATGIHVDVMFRHTRWIEEQLERAWERHEASVGYSTCFWHNVLTSKPLFDKRGWFATLQTKARQPYPEELRQRIVAKNYPILRDTLSSYCDQLRKAVQRCDRISVNHRVAALLASYFDIVFAVNRVPHPGEKRILRMAEVRCKELPEAMRDQVTNVLMAASGDGDVLAQANALIDSLEVLLQEQRLFSAGKDTV